MTSGKESLLNYNKLSLRLRNDLQMTAQSTSYPKNPKIFSSSFLLNQKWKKRAYSEESQAPKKCGLLSPSFCMVFCFRKRTKNKQKETDGKKIYFFLKRLKRFAWSFSRLPGLDSAPELTEVGRVWVRPEAGVLWLLISEGVLHEIAWIHEFISSWGIIEREQDTKYSMSLCVRTTGIERWV